MPVKGKEPPIWRCFIRLRITFLCLRLFINCNSVFTYTFKNLPIFYKLINILILSLHESSYSVYLFGIYLLSSYYLLSIFPGVGSSSEHNRAPSLLELTVMISCMEVRASPSIKGQWGPHWHLDQVLLSEGAASTRTVSRSSLGTPRLFQESHETSVVGMEDVKMEWWEMNSEVMNVVGIIMVPQRCLYTNPWKLCSCSVTCQGAIKITDEVMFAKQLTVTDYPGLSSRAAGNNKGPYMWKRKSECQRRRCDNKSRVGVMQLLALKMEKNRQGSRFSSRASRRNTNLPAPWFPPSETPCRLDPKTVR